MTDGLAIFILDELEKTDRHSIIKSHVHHSITHSIMGVGPLPTKEGNCPIWPLTSADGSTRLLDSPARIPHITSVTSSEEKFTLWG